jgi:transposase
MDPDGDRAMLRVMLEIGAKLHGFPSDMWTLRRVREVIEREFDIRYSISNVHLLLHGMGFSSQRAVRRAREQDVEAVAEFRKKQWPLIKKKLGVKAERLR